MVANQTGPYYTNYQCFYACQKEKKSILLLTEINRSKQDCLRMPCPTNIESLKACKLVKLNKQAVVEY
jgi:hypothetical protein